MLRFIDAQLNKITMYRLVLLGLGILWAVAVLLASLGIISLQVGDMIVSMGVLLITSLVVNWVLARLYGVPSNIESSYITALILGLIIRPSLESKDLIGMSIAAAIAMGGKYVLALYGKHAANPAAAAAVVVGLFGIARVTWWVGSIELLPLTVILGFLVVRKIRREAMVLTFIAVSVGMIIALGMIVDQRAFTELLVESFASWPIIFLGSIMLTEPLTTPPTKAGQYVYAVIVALLLTTRWNIWMVGASPQMALLLGNVVSYWYSSKRRIRLCLQEIVQMAPNIWDYIFTSPEPLRFTAGQYADWTLPAERPDDRGNRRTFTIASAPSEPEVHLGVKFYEPSSSYKKTLHHLQVGDEIWVGQVAGDFTLPTQNVPLLFLAGGIGVTPFRSMLKQLEAKNEARDIVLIYAAASAQEIVYRDVLSAAAARGISIIYVLSDTQDAPPDWNIHQGFVTDELLAEVVPDCARRRVYISGPNIFVEKTETAARKLGVPSKSIVTDFFAGY